MIIFFFHFLFSTTALHHLDEWSWKTLSELESENASALLARESDTLSHTHTQAAAQQFKEINSKEDGYVRFLELRESDTWSHTHAGRCATFRKKKKSSSLLSWDLQFFVGGDRGIFGWFCFVDLHVFKSVI